MQTKQIRVFEPDMESLRMATRKIIHTTQIVSFFLKPIKDRER